MIECPKCGFSQPKDQYCANCGVDMEKYIPVQPSKASQISNSSIFYVFLTVLIAIAIFLFIKKSGPQDMFSSTRIARGTSTILKKSTNMQNGERTNPAADIAVNSPQAQVTKMESDVPAPNTLATEEQKHFAPLKVRILFAEVDRTTIDVLQQESQSAGQFSEFGDFKSGVLPTNKKISYERGVRILDKVEYKFVGGKYNYQGFRGKKLQDNNELGISTRINIDPNFSNGIRGEIEVERSFHESQDLAQPPLKRGYPSTSFELSPGMSWMITLNLPLVNQEEPEKAEGILRIFQSPQFKSRQTEFTIFVEFDTSSGNEPK